MRKFLFLSVLSVVHALPSFAQSQAGLASTENASKAVSQQSGKPDSGLIV